MSIVEKTQLKGERRWRKNALTAFSRNPDGKYVECEFSLNLPMLRVKDLEPFLDFELAADESAWIREFQTWVREQFVSARAPGEMGRHL